jgi:pilus assembly protein Flp/PilA
MAVHLNEGRTMTKMRELVRKLSKDEGGAALIEYTVLLGILVVAVIATIVAVGGWVNAKWTALNTQINP